MRLKVLFSFIAIYFASNTIIAKEVTRSQAKAVALNFFSERLINAGKQSQFENLKIISTSIVESTYYVVNFNKGWTIVSAEDAIRPIIGYNYNANLQSESNNSNYVNFMQHFIEQKRFVEANEIESSPKIEDEWTYYLKDDFQPILNQKNPNNYIEPLLSSKWDQDFPYNYYCPEDINGPGEHTLVGCVATAMAQIMYYWRYPLQGSGSHSYYIYPYGTQSVDFGNEYYDYFSMQDGIDNNYPYHIAKLSYHAAVSVDMGFDPEGSAAYSQDVPHALETYFNYHSNCIYENKNNYEQSEWENMIKNDLEQFRPIYYSGRNSDNSGHAFVCDGYEEGNFYHFNFGWNGSGNGFYTLQDVNNFHYSQAMVYKIYPKDSNYPYIPITTKTLTSPSGSFTDGSGPYYYPMNMNAGWLIDPQSDTDSIVNIKLSFDKIETDSNLDEIIIYDGETEDANILGIYAGDTMPAEIYSTGNKLLITFKSGGGIGRGFKAEYKSILPIYCSAIETIVDSTGIISDGSGQFNYGNNTSCLYKFSQPDVVNYSFEIIEFNTEEDKDKVTFYNKNQDVLAELSGQLENNVIHFNSDELYMMWTTNSEINEKGWTLKYAVNGINSVEDIKLSNLSIYPNPTKGLLNVSFDIDKTNNLEVQLLNMNGQIVQQDIVNGFSGRYQNKFKLYNLPKGVYILSIISDKGKVDKKVVLK